MIPGRSPRRPHFGSFAEMPLRWKNQRFCDRLAPSFLPQPVQHNEQYVLKVLEDVGVVTRPQIDSARSRLNGEPGVLDILINDGVVSEVDISRTLAAQAHMDWINVSSMLIPPQVINQIRGEDARRFKVIPVAFGETGLVVAVGTRSTSIRWTAWAFFCNANWNWFAPVPGKLTKR